MKAYKKLTSLAAAGILFTAGTAMSATVLIDWSIATDISDPAGDGKYWNSLGVNGGNNDLATTALVDIANNASGFNVAVNVTLNGSNEGSAFGGSAIAGPSGADPFDETGATTDGLFANNNTVGTSVITFTGLGNAITYDFVAIGGRASNGGTGVISVDQGTSGSGSYNLLDDGTLLSFSVTSTALGVIEFDFSELLNDTNGTTNATWNALSMSTSTVPEPSAFALLAGMFGLTWVMIRRRA